MKKLLLFCIVFATAFTISAQNITGIVVDAETKLPLEGASVFAQNTTKGTITNKEGAYTLVTGKGAYELIVSYTGYISKTLEVEVSDNKTIDVELQKIDKSLDEIVITSTNEVADGWDKYGSFFISHFIGNTTFADSCKLMNPEVLKFYYYKRSDKLKVLATEPLQISNYALGYNLRYQLDSFVFYYKNGLNSYRGYCLYTLMEGDWNQQQNWKQNRRKAYYGSRLHFLRSYFDSTLKEEGFTVDMLTRSGKFGRLSNPYDTTYYLVNDSAEDVELWFPQKASITYIKEAPELKYLQQNGLPADVKMQISYVDMQEAVLLKRNGYFLDQRSWKNSGYWSWKNLADQLPYDYEPVD